MATKVFEGFDHYNVQADFLARSGWLQWQWIGGGSAPTLSFPTGRNSLGKCLEWSVGSAGVSTDRINAVFADRNAEAFIGHASKMPPQGTSPIGMWVFFYDTTVPAVQLSVHFNEVNYSVSVYRGDGFVGGATLLGTSANNVWTNTVWQFLEYHLKVATSGGSFEVRINNNVVLTITGVNTQASANAWFDSMAFATSPNAIAYNAVNFIDDFYYNDTTTGPGLVPANSYLGDASVATLFAIGNDSVAWTPLAGANWQEISEVAMDSDTSYNSTSTVGNEDRFNFAALSSALNTAFAVQVTGAYRKDDGGTRTIQQSVTSGGTETYGSSHNIPDTNYAYFTDLFVLNPTTGLNWTLTDINAIKGAYKLTA